VRRRLASFAGPLIDDPVWLCRPLDPAFVNGQVVIAVCGLVIMRRMDDAEQAAAVVRLRDGLSVMELAVSSRFTESLTRHGYEAAPADRTAVGTTDFRQRRTRMQSWVVGEAMEDVYRQVKPRPDRSRG
jgi:hypothetical protein